jgi:zinc protease
MLDSTLHPEVVDPSVDLQFPATSARVWTLPNGLGVIIQEDHSAPIASVQVWVESGSIHEDRHLGAGLSHLLEHMLFKGTKTRGASEFAQRIQDFGGYINAYTSFDRTVYWIDIPAKGVAIALDLLADAALNSTLPPDEFVKEQEVIRREFAMGYDDPDRMSSQTLFATAYREHPYRHPIIGHLDVFNTLQRDDVIAYYKARYVPNNMFIVVVGDVDAEKVRTQIAALFAPHSRAALPPVFLPKEPPQLGRRESHTEFETELSRLHLAWHVPEITHPDIPALDILAIILGSGRSSRFYKRLREESALVHSIDVWCYAPGEAGLFGVDAVLDPDKRTRVEAEVFRLLAQLHHSGVTGAELAKARKLSLSHQLAAVTTMRGRASDLGSNWLLTRNLDFSRDYLAALQRVTAEDLGRVMETYLIDRNLTAVSLNPPGSLSGTESSAAVPAAGEIQKFELSNGLRLLVREDSRLPLVSMVASFKAGLLAESPENNGVTRLLSRVLLKGTGRRTAEQLAEEIEAVGGSLSCEAGNNSVSVFVRVMQPDLGIGLDVLADVLTNASLPEKAVAREKEIQLASIKAEDDEMTVVARHLLREHLFTGHPYALRASGTPETVARLTREDLVAFRDQHFVASNGVLAIFGNVKASEVRALVEDALRTLPRGEEALTQPPQPKPLLTSREVVAIKPKAQAVLMIGFHAADVFHEDRAALELIDEACSDLGSRLFLRIREEMGLAYFVGSSQTQGLARGPFIFYCGTDPTKLEAVKGALLGEIHKLAEHGLMPEELARAKEKLLGQQDIRNQSNEAFSFACALDELYGLGFAHYRGNRAEIEGVTLADVARVARHYFNQPAITAIVRPNVA